MDATPEAEPESANPTPSSTGWRAWVGAAVLAVLIVAAGVFLLGRGDAGGSTDDAVAGPAGSNTAGDTDGGQFLGRGAVGEITAIDGATLTVDASGTTYTVVTDEDTDVTESTEGSMSDLEVGDSVIVIGEVTDGMVTAQAITEGTAGPGGGQAPGGGFTGTEPPPGFSGTGPPEGFRPPDGSGPGNGQQPNGSGPGGDLAGGFTAGEITAIDGDTLTVKAADGSDIAVTATGETAVTVTAERSVGDLAVGDTVQVVGTTNGDTIEAASIRVGTGGFGGFGGGPRGNGGTGPASGSQAQG